MLATLDHRLKVRLLQYLAEGLGARLVLRHDYDSVAAAHVSHDVLTKQVIVVRVHDGLTRSEAEHSRKPLVADSVCK